MIKQIEDVLKENVVISENKLELVFRREEIKTRISEIRRQLGYIRKDHAERRLFNLSQQLAEVEAKLKGKTYTSPKGRVMKQFMIREV